MSQLQALENVSTLEYEHEAVASNSDEKAAPKSASVQADVQISVMDSELEPIVTRKELWSYYRTSCRVPPHPREGIERLFSVLQWR